MKGMRKNRKMCQKKWEDWEAMRQEIRSNQKKRLFPHADYADGGGKE
jgi:hypothetical protein